jgi:cytochrome c biogenesis protein CcdA
MAYANVVLALFAGLFSILSACVLPLVPVVIGTAVSEHRLGPLARAAGLATVLHGHRAICCDDRLLDRTR